MSAEKPKSNHRLHIAFAVAVLIGAVILLFATERAANRAESAPAAAQSG